MKAAGKPAVGIEKEEAGSGGWHAMDRGVGSQGLAS